MVVHKIETTEKYLSDQFCEAKVFSVNSGRRITEEMLHRTQRWKEIGCQCKNSGNGRTSNSC